MGIKNWQTNKSLDIRKKPADETTNTSQGTMSNS